MSYSNSSIIRDCFESAFGRFFTPGRLEQIEGLSLTALFLPALTSEANKPLHAHSDFARAQWQHYGVHYEEKEYSGQGTLLLKKVLRAGKVRGPFHCCLHPAHSTVQPPGSLETLRIWFAPSAST